MAYAYSLSISIDPSKIGGSDLTNYKLLVSGTYAQLRTVANGGVVQSASGFDIVFTDSGGVTILDFDRVAWDGTTGACTFYVRIASVSASVRTVNALLRAGDPAITTDQQNKASTWSDRRAVLHMTSVTDLGDATGNGNNGTNTGFTTTTGIGVRGAVASDGGAGKRISIANSFYAMVGGSATHTESMWVKTVSRANAPVFWQGKVGSGIDTMFEVGATRDFYWDNGSVSAHYTGVDALTVDQTADGVWHHIAVIKTAAGDNGDVYVDGQRYTGGYTSGSLGNLTAGGSTVLGGYADAAGFNPNCSMMEFQIAAGIRTDIVAEYNNQIDIGSFYSTGVALLPGNPATAVKNFAYSQAIAAVVGTGPFTFVILSGTLPDGLALATNGTLSGTPTEDGSFPVTVQVTDALAATTSAAYTIHVALTSDIGPHDLTSNNSHPPFVVSASSEFLPAYRAFSADPTEGWAGATVSQVRLDMGAAYREAVVSYLLRAGSGGDVLKAPKDWTIRGSDDATSWTTLATVTNQTGWIDNEARLFFISGTTGYRYLEISITAINGGAFAFIGKLSYYRAGPTDAAPIVGLTLVAWVSFDRGEFGGNAKIQIGSADYTPGSIASPGGALLVYYDPTPIPLTAVTDAVNVLNPPIELAVTITETNADVSQTIIWFTIEGTSGGTVPANNFLVYGAYFRAYYADGTHRYAFPSQAQVEFFGTNGVDNPALAIDDTLDTAARVYREFFSNLSSPAFLRLSDFGPLEGVEGNCNNPPDGTQGVAYGPHVLTTTGGLLPYLYEIVSGALPDGLTLDPSGIITGTPTAAGVFPFTVAITSSTFSLDIPHEESQVVTISCSITIASANPDDACHSPSRIRDSYAILLTPGRYTAREIV